MGFSTDRQNRPGNGFCSSRCWIGVGGMGYAVRLSWRWQSGAGKREREGSTEGFVLSPRVANRLHPSATASRPGKNRAGSGNLSDGGARSGGMVSRRGDPGLLWPERCGNASAEGRGTTELLRLFGPAGGSAPEGLAQGDGIQSGADRGQCVPRDFKARPRTVKRLLFLSG